MTLSLNRSGRLTVFALAIAYTTMTFGFATSSAPLVAQNMPYYTATLAAPAEDDRPVAGGVAWTCRDTTCVANRGPSRPLRICRGLAREMGAITAFKVEGEDIAEDRLARCNGN
ncbi:CC_3452 family protein [Qipengyuania nanhaisediminis]|uniref:CC_3452 family protein n=1 Tax=Qipengyuania nanhaisediminis TaxID=604088 RepID=UPI0038B307C8